MPSAITSTKAAQVAEQLRAMIHDGRLSAGDLLPSTRSLAAELGVSRGTVVTAYEQLSGEGYIESRQGAASRVSVTLAGDRGSSRADPASIEDARGCFASVEVSLGPGLPRVSAISEREWRAAWRSAASMPLRDAFPDPIGERRLRTEITKQLAFSRGFAPVIEDVIITSGTSESISLVVEAHGAGCRMAVEDPGYRTGYRAAESAGATIVPVGVDHRGMILEDLFRQHAESPIDIVMVTPSHQYPLGGVMTLTRRQALLEWAAAEDVLIVEDDYDSEFRHSGAPLPALAAIDSAGVVAHLGSFSKILNPQLRTGYIVTPSRGPFADRLREVRAARGGAVAVVAQDALTHLLATGAVRRHITRLGRDYRHRRELLIRSFSGFPGVKIDALSGGLHAVITWAVPWANNVGYSQDVVRRLRRRGVEVAQLSDYAVTDASRGQNGIVIGYGQVSTMELVAALSAVLEELTSREGQSQDGAGVRE